MNPETGRAKIQVRCRYSVESDATWWTAQCEYGDGCRCSAPLEAEAVRALMEMVRGRVRDQLGSEYIVLFRRLSDT